MRIWRALKSTHCATLREGVYLLPATATSAKAFWDLDAAIRVAGAESHLLVLQARDAAQEAGFVALFDRSALYLAFSQSLKGAKKSFKSAAATEIRKALRELELQLQSILAADFFPGQAAASATSGLGALRHESERQLSPGEPASTMGQVPLLSASDYQGRTGRRGPDLGWTDWQQLGWCSASLTRSPPSFGW